MADGYLEGHRCNCGAGILRTDDTGYVLVEAPARDAAMPLAAFI
jgi:hypothetical protein